MAGHNQSPAGIFATTSTRPYLIPACPLVLIRPDLTGFIIVWLVAFVASQQLYHRSDVQEPSAVKFKSSYLALSKLSSWSVGAMTKFPPSIYTFSVPFVVNSNSPLLYTLVLNPRKTASYLTHNLPVVLLDSKLTDSVPVRQSYPPSRDRTCSLPPKSIPDTSGPRRKPDQDTHQSMER